MRIVCCVLITLLIRYFGFWPDSADSATQKLFASALVTGWAMAFLQDILEVINEFAR